MRTDDRITRRTFSTLLGAGTALAPSLLLGGSAVATADGGSLAPPVGSAHEGDALQSEFLMELVIYLTCRGIAYPVPGGGLHSRILPFFETASARYAWLNNVVAVGVLRPVPAKISYRVFQIL